MMGVFVSYSHEDKSRVTEIVETIKSRSGQDLWYDKNLRGGDRYFSVIAKEILKNEYFVFIVSENSVKSDWCYQELTFAMAEKRKIIAVWLENFCAPPEIRLIIQNTHYMNYYDMELSDFETEIERCFSVQFDWEVQDEIPEKNARAESDEKYFLTLNDINKIDRLLQLEAEGKYSQCFEAENAVLLGLAYELGIKTEKDLIKAKFYYRVGMFKDSEDARFLYAALLIEDAEEEEKETYLNEMRSAADNGGIMAMTYYGDVCYHGLHSKKKDIVAAVEYWKKAAEKGSAEAQYNMAFSYRCGDGIEKDEALALMYALSAAEQGFAKAYRIIGVLYKNGEFVKKNLELAKQSYEKGLKLGDYLCRYYIGVVYKSENMLQEAVECFEEAVKYADDGVIKSGWPYNKLACCLAEGTGVEKDAEKAVELHFKAIEAGNQSSKREVVDVICDNFDKDKKEELLLKASQLDCVDAEDALGEMFEDDDTDKALKYYTMGADKGNLRCIMSLLLCYSKPLGGREEYVNRELALKYFQLFFSLLEQLNDEKVISDENTMKLYFAYAKELDAPGKLRDETLAIYYYKKCLEMGNDFAENIIGYAGLCILEEEDTEDAEKDVIHGAELLALADRPFKKSIREGTATAKTLPMILDMTVKAYNYLAECYRTGSHIQKDLAKSEECMKKANEYVRLKNAGDLFGT